MLFEPEELPPSTPPLFDDSAGDAWVPLYRHGCTFGPDLFVDKMMNMVRNPNLNSSWLFRADILYDDDDDDDDHDNRKNDDDNETAGGEAGQASAAAPIPRDINGFLRRRTLVRKLIPRNDRRDRPMEQTCTIHRSESPDGQHVRSLVLYMPHAASAAELPFYHPKVCGIAHLHEWEPARGLGSISTHFLPFRQGDLDNDQKLRRMAYHLLEILHKHGQGGASGYVKRVHHDVVIPQPKFQDRYTALKNKYARQLVDTWAESTDPGKHVFEDLGIAAFLIELWDVMYKDPAAFPGFVDIGCGNGLLVYILNKEGYAGWGFDARARKSWAQYCTETTAGGAPAGRSLEQRLLLPRVVPRCNDGAGADTTTTTTKQQLDIDADAIQDGTFPPGTFIVSNHADELTPWTPILGALSRCPFITIPCCSHSLTGERFRAPPPRDRSKPKSTYASLVDWVAHIAEDCGWDVETEHLRIPSTRNVCLLGRRRRSRRRAVVGDGGGDADHNDDDANDDDNDDDVDIDAVLHKYGGVEGYFANVAKLVKSGPRSH
ncbi:tRNA(Ser) (uridine(44)-2'-O)-methyltransferase [Purpureocillium takamizusanense]|uniref:tRNA (uracil-O(2)-)-methyltransferase n=1 Tax=Purpureocillium takamizusanense TaxID=2060973 RepID=A0A9Q8QT67_9HYPO|nr:tRNA(Ser) (uridine(44)-2'-O)-methyltransferase [Purpureocillium takamizusanense]UNI24224.1 tRNA(Ser) (uridine(44)-2'-O)-methyltransferase [Purpureocillium takamizusanense]